MANSKIAPILEVKNLGQHFKYGFGKNKFQLKAVDDISFFVNPGEVFSLVGESGCGKTTTGRTIIQLYNPTDGEIYFKGERIAAGFYSLNNEIKAVKKAHSSALKELAKELREKTITADEFNAQKNKLNQDKEDTLNNIHKEIEARKVDNKKNNRPLLRKMQMIFQDPIASLNPRMTIKEIIAEGLIINGIRNKAEINKRVEVALETVGLLPEHGSRYPHEFSGGQRQRIGIARSLIVEPDFIIADEPVSALDVSIQAQVINLLNDLRVEKNITILFIAHDLSVVKYFSDRIAVMYFGKIVELADKDTLFKNPLHPYTLSLLSAIPQPDPDFEKARPPKVRYNPELHDYSTDTPSLKEVAPNHFVYCNDAEFKAYQAKLKQ